MTVLEASSRIGGRIHSVDFKKNIVEMGAQWIHGEKGNVVLEIAQQLGHINEDPSLTRFEDLSEAFVDEKGDFWDESLVERVKEIAEKSQTDIEDHAGGNKSPFFIFHGRKITHFDMTNSFFFRVSPLRSIILNPNSKIYWTKVTRNLWPCSSHSRICSIGFTKTLTVTITGVKGASTDLASSTSNAKGMT